MGDPRDVARKIVERGVAPIAAAGFAWRRGDRWELSSGEGTEVERATIFDLASLTKPMTALAIARVGLDHQAPLAEMLNEAVGTASASVPLEFFLAHRAGLEANLPLFESLLSGGAIERQESSRRAASARRADAIGTLPDGGFAPLYSDLGYILAGEALARATSAEDAGDAIVREIVMPLGLERVLGTARSLKKQSVGFAERVAPTEVVPWRGGEVRGLVHDENAWALTGDGGCGHAGMFGTIDAVLRFGCAAFDTVAHSNGPTWLVVPRPGGSLRAGFDGKSEERSSAGRLAGPRTFGHLGFTGTSLWIDPDAEIVVALLTNRVHPTRENVAIREARPEAHDALWKMGRTMANVARRAF